MKRNYLSTLLLISFTLSACVGGGSDRDPQDPPTRTVQTIGSFQPAQNCDEIQAYVQEYRDRAEFFANRLIDTNTSNQEEAGNVPLEAPMAEANGAANGGNSVTQSDLAHADRERNLLFAVKPFGQGNSLKVFSMGTSPELLSSFTLEGMAETFRLKELLPIEVGTRRYLILFGYDYNELLVDASLAHPAMGTQSRTIILDVSNPSQIQELYRESHPGYFLEARAIEQNGKKLILWQSQRMIPTHGELQHQQLFPEKTITENGVERREALTDCPQTLIYQNETLPNEYVPSFLMATDILQLEIQENTIQVESQSLLSSAWNTVITANPQHLFIGQNIGDWQSTKTELFQFSLAPLQLKASGEVAGRILNQFFMDENNAILRVFHQQGENVFINLGAESRVEPGVAATAQTAPNPRGNYLSTFQMQGNQLVVLDRFGPFETDEDSYAARFLGNRACVITFRRIDPLTCFDLSNPAEIKKLGELELPGVSYHLEAINEALLLGIGQGSENGSVVANLFDISNPSQPRLAAQKVLTDTGGEIWSYSPVFYDYRALGLEGNTRFAVPLVSYHDTPEGHQTSIAIFSVDPETKSFVDEGQIKQSMEDYQGFVRALFFDNTLAGIAGELKVFTRPGLEEVFSSSL